MAYQTAATRALMQQLRLSGGVEAITLSGNRTLTAKDANILFLDPGGSARDITLLAEDEADGLFFVIVNEADAAENLVIKDDGANTIVTINQNEWAIVACDGTNWRDVPTSAIADALATSNTWTAAQAINAALTTTRGVSSGTALKVGGLAYSNTAASTAITGATEAETNFDVSYSLPANSLTAGAVVRIRAQGIHTATTGAETHSILLKLGSNTVVSKAAVDPANNDVWVIDATLVCRTAGASGTVVGAGLIGTGASGSAALTGWALASLTVDTTQALTVAVAIDRQAGATDADSARLDVLTVEVMG